MNIVATSNYDNELFTERVVVEGSKVTLKMLEEILHTMNNSKWRSDEVWYQLKPDDYKLRKFEP